MSRKANAGGAVPPVGAQFGCDPRPVLTCGILPADGNAYPFLVDAAGLMQVNVVSGGGGGSSVSPTTTAFGQVAIPTTAGGTLLLAAQSTRKGVTFVNTDTVNTVYIGPNGLTAANGFPVYPGGTYTSQSTAAFYALAVGGTVTVAYGGDYV